MGVDHNIIRHTSQPMQADDLSDDYYQYDEFGDEDLTSSSQKQAISRIVHVKKEIPNTSVKTSMRIALFGFLEASQNDEDVLVWSIAITFIPQIISSLLTVQPLVS